MKRSSGKFVVLGERAAEVASRQEKMLVFTQYREMIGPLADYLAGVFGREGLILHGGTPVSKLVTEMSDDELMELVKLDASGRGD
ncbi:MAG: hypothetical protein IJU44_00115 [Kiritimatiellae bacterium]|nr:hypothetical protein [Kiritimatiellia bacterium]